MNAFADLTWGFPVVLYMFLGGMGAGTLVVSSSVLLRGGGGAFGGESFRLARFGALIAPLPVIIGCAALVFELGSFGAGHWFKWINLYKVMNLSPMSVGTWLLTAFIILSVANAYLYVLPGTSVDDRFAGMRKVFAMILIPVGLGVAVYTGVLLGAMPSRPFWNSPVLALLFMLSSISTGIAALMLARTFMIWSHSSEEAEQRFHDSGYTLSASDLLMIGLECVAVFLFLMYGHLTVGSVNYATDVILPGGLLARTFWVWFVLVGLIFPALVEMYYVFPRLVQHRDYWAPRSMELVVAATVLIGGFMLRYVVLLGGQITWPVGV